MEARLVVLFLSFVLLVSCGGKGDGASASSGKSTTSLSSTTSTSSTSESLASSSASSSLSSQSSSQSSTKSNQEKLINEIATLLSSETCTQVTPTNCEMVDVSFVPAAQSLDPKATRILVIDYGASSLAMMGYRNRVLELFETDAEMKFTPHRPTLSMPVTADKVFTAIEQYDGALSVDNFSIFNTPPNQRLFGQIPNIVLGGHGYYIAAFLLEHNPTAQFVFVDQGAGAKLVSPVEECARMLSSNSEERNSALEVIKTRHKNYSESIQKIVQDYQIDFINASWGLSGPVLRKAISQICGAQPDASLVTAILEIDRQFMKEITHLKYQTRFFEERQITLVQAGAAGYSSTLVEGDADFPADCDSSMANRIRVMDMYYAETDIAASGSSNLGLLSESDLQARQCIDVYLPLGQHLGSSDPITGQLGTRIQTMKTLMYGLFEFNIFPLLSTPSMAAPVVLSALVHQQSQSDVYLTPPELFNRFLNGNIIQDPILHNQFDVYRMGYRKTSW